MLKSYKNCTRRLCTINFWASVRILILTATHRSVSIYICFCGYISHVQESSWWSKQIDCTKNSHWHVSYSPWFLLQIASDYSKLCLKLKLHPLSLGLEEKAENNSESIEQYAGIHSKLSVQPLLICETVQELHHKDYFHGLKEWKVLQCNSQTVSQIGYMEGSSVWLYHSMLSESLSAFSTPTLRFCVFS